MGHTEVETCIPCGSGTTTASNLVYVQLYVHNMYRCMYMHMGTSLFCWCCTDHDEITEERLPIAETQEVKYSTWKLFMYKYNIHAE